MRAPRTAQRRPGLRLAGVTASIAGAAMLVTACGTAPAPGAPARPAPARPAPASPTGAALARTGSSRPADPRAAAATLARHLLTALRLPPGSRSIAVPARPVPGLPMTGPYGPGIVTITRLYKLTVPVSAAYARLRAQHPAGAAVAGYGPYRQGGRVVSELVSFALGPLPSWLYSVRLYTAVKPAAGGSQLLAEAQAEWYPARSPADQIDPARYASVTVTRLVSHHATARTLTGGQLRRLAAAVNALHAMPDLAVACPAMGPGIPSYRLTFNPLSTAPAIVIDPTRCLSVEMTVGGSTAPPLFPASSLIAAARRALASGPAGG